MILSKKIHFWYLAMDPKIMMLDIRIDGISDQLKPMDVTFGLLY